MKKIVWIVCWMAITVSIQSQTMEERTQWIEHVRHIVQGEDERANQKLFSMPFYADNQKVFYTEFIDTPRPKEYMHNRYVKRFDIEQALSSVFVPLPLDHTFRIKTEALDNPIQRALFEDDGRIVMIEMNFDRGTWTPLLLLPIELAPHHLKEIPNRNQFAFSYPQNGFEHNNPDLFGLDILDVNSGERHTILSQIKRQNSPVSSMWRYLPFLFLDKDTLLYSETLNPYRDEVDLHRFFEQFKIHPPYDVLWRMNTASGVKIQLATCDLQSSSELILQDNTVVWNRIEIGSATDILQRKK